MKTDFHKRRLPHLQPLGGTFFVTFNLVGSIPDEVLNRWRVEFKTLKDIILRESKTISLDLEKLGKLDFAKKDKFFDTYTGGNHHLKSDSLAEIVANALHHWDGKYFELFCYCIMSNHVHVVFRLFDTEEIDKPRYLQEVMHSIKLFSAIKCNKLLGKTGAFWHHESYDRLVRDDAELKRIMQYIVNNPVKAGLCKEMKDWKWSYVKHIYNDIM